MYENFLSGFKRSCKKNNHQEKKEMEPLTIEESHKQKTCHIRKKKFCTDDDGNKKNHKVRDYCHYTGKYGRTAHKICNLRCKKNSCSIS